MFVFDMRPLFLRWMFHISPAHIWYKSLWKTKSYGPGMQKPHPYLHHFDIRFQIIKFQALTFHLGFRNFWRCTTQTNMQISFKKLPQSWYLLFIRLFAFQQRYFLIQLLYFNNIHFIITPRWLFVSFLHPRFLSFWCGKALAKSK